MVSQPSWIPALLTKCETRFFQLAQSGVSEDVARDRVFDAYDHAFSDSTEHCFDKRDRVFENLLRTTKEKEVSNATR